jgi:hypothetical protein
MREIYEISDRFIEAGDANGLLYEPLAGGLTYRRSRRYEIQYEGDQAAMEAFVRKTLLDEISQELHQGEDAALTGYSFALEYGMKPGALDLEKEAILSYYRGIPAPGFELKDLRIYLFGGKGDESVRFVRDLCNAAIHQWNVLPGHV